MLHKLTFPTLAFGWYYQWRRLVLDLGLIVLLLGGLIAWSLFRASSAPSSNLRVAVLTVALLLAPPLVLSLIERLLPAAGPRKSGRQWLLHLQMMMIYYLTIGFLSFLAISGSTTLFKHFNLEIGLIDLRFAEGYGLWGLLGASLLSSIVLDFFFYWIHRAMHQIPFLWEHHKLHHMDVEFDAMTGPRQNVVEAAFAVVFLILPLTVLFKFDSLNPLDFGLATGIVVYMFGAIRYINHSSLRIQFGWASVLFTTSQVHRIHHSGLAQHRDKNFAAFYPVLDVIFRTYYAPARNEFPPTGVDGEREIQSPWEAQIFSFREWKRWISARRGPGKLGVGSSHRITLNDPAPGKGI